MRVLMTTDTVGGVWTYAVELSHALAERGVEVALAAMGGRPSADQRAEAYAVPGLELHESALRLPWMPEPWADVERARHWLRELAARLRPDVVHHNEPVYASLDLGAPAVAVGHSCVCSWWESVRGGRAPAEWDRYRTAMADGLAAAHAVVAPTAAMRSALERHYGVHGAHVVPNARSPRHFRPGCKEPFVMAAGRLWDEAKNVAALAAVAPGLAWPVFVAGDARLARTPNFHHLGRLPSRVLAYWVVRASIYAHPARYEPFGLGVLEAGLGGCALVLGDLPSLREVWDDAALYVPPDDHAALREALAGLAADGPGREALGRRARERALAYAPARMAARYLEIYAAAGAASRPGRPGEAVACAS